MCPEEPSKAALKNKKKREAKARRKMEEQQRGTEDGDAGLGQQMSAASLNWMRDAMLCVHIMWLLRWCKAATHVDDVEKCGNL